MDQLDQQHSGAAPGSKGSLLRLGLLMAVTMTLHNLPGRMQEVLKWCCALGYPGCQWA
jgi:hypothetical protein